MKINLQARGSAPLFVTAAAAEAGAVSCFTLLPLLISTKESYYCGSVNQEKYYMSVYTCLELNCMIYPALITMLS